MATTHQRFRAFVPATLLLVLAVDCPQINKWGEPHSSAESMSAARPECPRSWDSIPIFGAQDKGSQRRRGGTIINGIGVVGAGGMALSGPITNIPEFHDCQRFLVPVAGQRDSVRYDSLYAIFAAFKLDSISGALGLGAVTWTSANASIATVDATGRVTAGAVGNVTITATSIEDPTHMATANILVEIGAGSGSIADVGISPNTPPPLVKLKVSQLVRLVATVGATTTRTLPVAEIYTYGNGYRALGIGPNFNCLYVFFDGAGELRARMVKAPDLGADWDACVGAYDPRAPGGAEHTELTIIRTGAPGPLPGVARWDWDQKSKTQYIGVKCGDAWCEIGPRAGFEPSHGHGGSGTTSAAEETVLGGKGWYDEQFLAIDNVAGAAATPTRLRGTVIPHPNLQAWQPADFRNDAALPGKDWVPVAYVALGAVDADPKAAKYYKSKFGFDLVGVQAPLTTMNQLFLCFGTKDHCQVTGPDAPKCPDRFLLWPIRRWWTKIISAQGEVRYKCTTRRDHSGAPAGVTIPGTTRWRWLANDETVWEECAAGCCEVEVGDK